MKRSHDSIILKGGAGGRALPHAGGRRLQGARVTAALLLDSDDTFNWILIKSQTAALAAVTSGVCCSVSVSQDNIYSDRRLQVHYGKRER